MPTYYARKAGNINATDVWATTPGGTASAVTFASGDVLVSNSFAIAINVSTDLGGSGQLRNDTLGGATAGGTFTLAAGLTLTANILQNNATSGANVVNCTFSAPFSASIVGNVTSVNTGGFSRPVSLTGNGTLNFTGNATGDLHSTGAGGAIGNVGGGTINFVGTATGGGGALGYALENASSGTINITGNCLGAVAPAVGNTSTGTINITGQALGTTTTGGGAGVANTSTGAVFATRAVGGSFGPGSSSVTAAPGIANSSTGIVEIEQLQYGTLGMSPTSGGGIRLKKLGSNVAVFNYCDTVGAKTLIDATQNAAMPAANHVRSGLSYAGGAATGTLAVPLPSQVAVGVATDNTTGTAFVTGSDIATAVWGAATRSITGGTVDTLTNPPTVPTVVQIRQEMDSNSTKLSNLDATISSRSTLTTGDLPSVPSAASVASAVRTELTEISNLDASVSSRLADADYTAPTSAPTAAAVASAVRTELTEISNLDASVSSRLASASYTAPANSDITAIKSKTDSLPASPAAVSDIPTAAQIATAVEGSLLNEADGQAVLNAIVGAIGNTNLSEVSLVAAVRADLERTGGKMDSIPTTAAPTAAQNATAVWGAATRSVTGGTVDTLTNAPASVTPSDIWSHATRTLTSASGPTAVQIRQEMDSNSTQLSAIKAKTDNLPADPADQSLLEAAIAGVTAPTATTVASAVRSELSSELAKVSALNTERLANVATTAIVGNLLAQANS